MATTDLTIAFGADLSKVDPAFQRVTTGLRQIDQQAQVTGRSVEAAMAKVTTGAQGVGNAVQTVAGALQSAGLAGASSPIVTGLEAIGTVTSRVGQAMTLLGEAATGPLGLIVATVTTAVTVFQNWEAITGALNRAFGASTAGMDSARRATELYTGAVDALTRATETATEAQARLARQAAETLRVTTTTAIQGLQAELELQHGLQERYRSTADQVEELRRLDPEATITGAAARRFRDYEQARDRAQQIVTDIEALRARLAGVVPHGFDPSLPTPPVEPEGGAPTGGGGGAARPDQELQDVYRVIQGQQRDMERADQNLQRIGERTRQLIDPTLQYRDAIEDVRAAQEAGYLTTEEAAAATAHYQRQIDAASGSSIDFAKTLERAASSSVKSLVDDLLDVASGAKTASEAFSDFAVNFTKLVAQMIAQQAALAAISAIFGSPTGGGVKTRMAGGPVTGGETYLVGEGGPELFVPRVSGSIVPNHALGGGPTVVVQNNAPGVLVTTQEVDERTVIASVNLARTVVARDYRQSMRSGYGPYSENLSAAYQMRRRL